MDTIVREAMAKWPDVPDVHGWLRLDERGAFRIRAADFEQSGRFEVIANPALVAFIGRNYQSDARGRWFFQNGPQRVFVALAATPWVYRLDAAGGVLTHTGVAATTLDAVLVDETASMVYVTELGPGLVDDRDLAQVVAALRDHDCEPLSDVGMEQWFDAPEAGRLWIETGGRRLPVEPVRRDTLPHRFGFDPAPAPG